jgi:ubiquinone/menaquinone biosynthesis C-methylase UbiE
VPAYERFAGVYDAFMADTPYFVWADYITAHIPPRSLVADLACGTGNMTLLLKKRGFDMIGIDRSSDMLSVASEKTAQEGLDILYLAQDVVSMDLYGTMDAMVSVCDGFNYLLTEDILFAAFKRCALFLNPGGVFIFDMNTEYKFKEILGGNTFTDTRKGASYVWKNNYNAHTFLNEYSVFFMTGTDSFTETHRQRAYTAETVIDLLKSAGFSDVRVNDAYTYDAPKPDSVRVSFITKRMI